MSLGATTRPGSIRVAAAHPSNTTCRQTPPPRPRSSGSRLRPGGLCTDSGGKARRSGALRLVSAELGTSMGCVSTTAPVLAELPELLVAGSMLEAVTAFGRRVQVRVESVDGTGADVACPDGAP